MTPRSTTDLPTGVLTFCLTDLEDSAMYWDRDAAAMAAAVARHQAMVTVAVAAHDGVLLLEQGEGDSTVSVFVRPGDAVRAAARIQQEMNAEDWPTGIDLRVRIGLNTGEAEQRDGTYYGPALNRAGRIRALAAGGQTFLARATAELVEDAPPAGASIRPLGSVELRGLSRSEQIHALELEGMEAAARLDASSESNVPVMLTTFIGRSDDRARLRAALADARIVTLTGPGGSGKTRLSVEVASDIAAEGASRVWFVDLAPLADGVLVADTVASTIGAAADGGDEARDDIDRIVASIGSRTAMLVLDNCEHLVAACGDLARAAVARCPNLRILATSQLPLAVAGEALVPLPPLSVPTEGASGDEVATAEAVQLLVDRARRHDPNFELTQENAVALAEICRRLDGLPLALELAAAHLRLLAPEQMLERLGADRFRLLAQSTASPEARHRALEPTLDWSYGLLDERARTLLTRLSVFSGGFTLPAAEAVCSGPDLPGDEVYVVLADLVSRSLVAHRSRGGQMRYWLLETIREYATKKLETASPVPASWSIRREGQYWTLEGARVPIRLRDSKGLGYLATLLERPNRDVHVLELASPGGVVGGSDDDVLDGPALAAYRQRLALLTQERDEAEAANDTERVTRLDLELEAFTDELSKATGLGGKSRRTTGPAERARMSVTKALRGAIDKITAEAPAIGAHLDRSIRTGALCSYRPAEAARVRLAQ